MSNLPLAPLRYAYYRRVCGIKIGRVTSIWTGARFTGDKMHEIHIGDYCSIPYNSFWVAGAPITVGDHVVFGHGVEIYTSDHDPDDPAFSRRDAPVAIANRAWIGSRVIILKGVAIGEGAVVAAGSLVTEDVPPYTIVAGRPARYVRERGPRELFYDTPAGPWYF
ncbi:MAG: acyltransferase [Anaerolineales bacterium]